MCTGSRSALYHSSTFLVVNVPFVLPLCLYVLLLAARQWRSRARMSNTDVFTCNMVFSQLVSVAGFCLLTYNQRLKNKLITAITMYLYLINSSVIIIFQIFTCLDRFMAVVHPIAYLRLKSQTWTLIRNIVCALIWLHSLIESFAFLFWIDKASYIFVAVVSYSFALSIVLFCNLSVLCVLMRPGPGDGSKGNRSKQRALYTITAITGTLLLKFAGDLFSLWSFTISGLSGDSPCALFLSSIWFSLPSTLFLPLLFLRRKDKIPCFKTNK